MITETDILWWGALDTAYAFKRVRRVCEIGQQELVWHTPEAKEICARFADMCEFPDIDLTRFKNSRDFWGALGRKSLSIDIAGDAPCFRKMDLNADSVPWHLRRSFDFVSNVGTSEHVINQVNLFKVMHDLTRPTGLMVHAVPCGGYTGHGLFNYNMKFFTLLAKANDYHCIDAWISADAETKAICPDIMSFTNGAHGQFKNARSGSHHPLCRGNSAGDFRAPDTCLYVALRKTGSRAFRLPLDV